MTNLRLTALSGIVLAIAACRSDAPTEPGFEVPGTGPDLAISDATHQAGVPQFYWLPPTVPNPGPTVTGTFDGNLLGGPGSYPRLEVRICPAGVAPLCPAGGSFQSFDGYSTTPAITADQAAENYQLLWNKPSLVAGSSYRAWVLVRPAANATSLALGFADVKVVASSKALKQVDPSQFVGLVAGNPLYLKFTVRTGIPGAVTVALGTSTLPPAGSTTATATVTDLHGAVLAGATVSWGVTPAGSPPGTVNPTTSTTGSNGTATTQLTAGNSDGTGSVTATVGAAPAQLTGSASFTVGSSAIAILQESLATGSGHTCGLTTSGVPWCWGYNLVGQLGDDSSIDRHAPVAVILPSGVSGFASLTAGNGHTCALTSSGLPYCWGANEYGQLGDNSTTIRRTPVPVSLPSGVPGFVSLSAGDWHTCGLTSTGAVYCWGWNISGQLGDNSTTNSSHPVAVSLPSGVTGFASLASGEHHTCALSTTGTAWCWGVNSSGQLGNNSTIDSSSPVPVSMPFGVAGFVSLTADAHTCARTSTGAAWCWGQNAAGQLGNNQSVASYIPDAVILPSGVTGFTSLTAGGGHTCGLANTGVAYCWGLNVSGQIGDNSTYPWFTPAPVSLPSGVTAFASLAAGGAHTCGVTGGGVAYCWGWNFRGQIGDNTTLERWTPQAVVGGLIFQAP